MRLEQASKQARDGTLNRQRALAIVDEIMSTAGESVLMDSMTTRVFLERNLPIWSRGLAAATVRKYTALVRQYLDFLGALADKPMAMVDSSTIAAYRDQRAEDGLASKTISFHLNTLRMWYGEAVAQGRLTENPVAEVKAPRRRKNEREAKRPFTWPEIGRILRACPPGEWRLLVLVGLYTGQRLKDCLGLAWSQIDLERGVIHFRRGKNRDEFDFDVPIHPYLRRHLICWRCRNGFDLLFPRLSEYKSPHWVSAKFVDMILPEAGFETAQARREGGGRNVKPYSFHSLRHTLNTALNVAGATETDRMRIVGHESKVVSRGYTHAQLEHVSAVLARLPRPGGA
ncbi:MAG: site-specific integrase [Verrucomicrobiota bacterium]